MPGRSLPQPGAGNWEEPGQPQPWPSGTSLGTRMGRSQARMWAHRWAQLSNAHGIAGAGVDGPEGSSY